MKPLFVGSRNALADADVPKRSTDWPVPGCSVPVNVEVDRGPLPEAHAQRR